MLYVYDYCIQKTVEAERPSCAPYYSKLVFRGGTRGRSINYKNRPEVCKVCTRQGTKYCAEVAQEVLKERAQTGRLKLIKEKEGGTVVAFRSQRR